MHRFFLRPEQFLGETARITGSEHQHLAKVLRMRPGEAVCLLDNTGRAFRAVLKTIEKNETVAQIEGAVETPPEPATVITVAQALGKGDKFEQVVQHGTEVGASVFIPIRAERSVADVPAAKAADKVARWQQIAKGAAEQSGRARIPEVQPPLTLRELIASRLTPAANEPNNTLLALLLSPDAGTVALREALAAHPMPARILVAIGPEGGWSPAEVSAARAANMSAVTLGPRILRTETAALVAVSQILYHYEKYEK